MQWFLSLWQRVFATPFGRKKKFACACIAQIKQQQSTLSLAFMANPSACLARLPDALNVKSTEFLLFWLTPIRTNGRRVDSIWVLAQIAFVKAVRKMKHRDVEKQYDFKSVVALLQRSALLRFVLLHSQELCRISWFFCSANNFASVEQKLCCCC